MQAKDWLDRWRQNHIGFHQGEVNNYLKQYINLFNLKPGDRVFMPLCGKAHDIAWLAKQGFKVVGIELSDIAIESFFSEFEMQFQQFESDRFVMRKSGNIMMLQGDYFDLQAEDLQGCRLVYDRAALIAIDEPNRPQYSEHMQALTSTDCDMLLITLDYNQSVFSGPPFAVSPEEVFEHYQKAYQIELLETQEVVDEQPRWREQGMTSLLERVYRLTRARS